MAEKVADTEAGVRTGGDEKEESKHFDDDQMDAADYAISKEDVCPAGIQPQMLPDIKYECEFYSNSFKIPLFDLMNTYNFYLYTRIWS
jgi:hypothetical protein